MRDRFVSSKSIAYLKPHKTVAMPLVRKTLSEASRQKQLYLFTETIYLTCILPLCLSPFGLCLEDRALEVSAESG
jgi:hypothetical protein